MSWSTVPFGKLCNLVNGKAYKPSDWSDKGLPIIRIQNLNDQEKPFNYWDGSLEKQVLVKDSDVLLAWSGTPGTSFGAHLWKRGDAVLNQHIFRVDLDPSVISKRWAIFALNKQLNRLIDQSHGRVGLKHVTKGMVEGFGIPLPPLVEQKRIAAILDNTDAIRRKRRQAIQLADEFLRSAFLDMFGDLTKNEKKWETVRFGDVSESRLGKMLDAKQQTGKNRKKYLRNANVQWDRFDLNSLLEMDFSEKDRKIFRLKHGDLLICEGGEVGRSAIWRDEIAECYFQKALHRVRPKHKMATAEYLLHLMWFYSRNGGFKDHATSATIAHLTGVKLKDMVMPLPPIELQKRFSDYYFTTKSIKIKYSHLTNESNSLFNSISQRAFRGEL